MNSPFVPFGLRGVRKETLSTLFKYGKCCLTLYQQLKEAETIYLSITPSINHKLMERPGNYWTLQVLMG